ncbi:MAG: hypothetical protein RA161_01430 [Arsenophonus sp.]|nr:MAG: hypothetical protein RA161_01430 [Arsenophonus sp.]
MKKIILLFLINLCILSCTSNQKIKNPSLLKNKNFSYKNYVFNNSKKINKETNWNQIILSLINELLKEFSFKENQSLLINSIKNNTNIFIPNKYITNMISDIIKRKNIITISPEQINETYKKIGLLKEDNLISCAKEIMLARYIHSKYVLCLEIFSYHDKKLIEIKLIETKSGEIFYKKTSEF